MGTRNMGNEHPWTHKLIYHRFEMCQNIAPNKATGMHPEGCIWIDNQPLNLPDERVEKEHDHVFERLTS